MYTIKLLNDAEYDALPYRYAKKSLGCADAKKGIAFVRQTGVPKWDMKTLEHEVQELVAKTSPHEFDGIRYKDEPEIPTPTAAPTYKTLDQLFAEATGLAQTQYPGAYGAREGALADLAKGTEYYSQFMPTSLEQALGSQYFQNLYPEAERSILGTLSKTGMAYSPITAELLAREKGKLGFDVGSFLANLGQRRGEFSLQNRLNIDPSQMTNPLMGMGQQQDYAQKQADYEYQLAKQQADYYNMVAKARKKASSITSMSGMGGAAIALGLAPFTGGASLAYIPMAMAAGQQASPLWGGSSGGGGMDMGTALSMMQMYGGGGGGFGGGGYWNQPNQVSPQYQLGSNWSLPSLSSGGVQNVS